MICCPGVLRPMVLKYFHNSPMSGHLGAFKTWKKVGHQFYWSKLRDDVFHYVHQRDTSECKAGTGY
jgi:hypothetical protein